MPRQVRIEFPGATYHVMCRGDRREPIYADDDDRRMYLATLAEVVARTGWLLHAYVLMGNHYHLIIETPEPNLVRGMAWLQTTYTARYNARHRCTGHLFAGRYKAILVDPEDGRYLSVLLDYLHLNPVRAGLISARRGEAVVDYPWSSLPGYASVRHQPAWLSVERGLASFEWTARAADRRAFVKRVEQRAQAEAAKRCGYAELEGQSLQSTLRRGWYFGREVFREWLLEQAKSVLTRHRSAGQNYHGEELKAHGEAEAERLIAVGLREHGLKEKDLPALKRSDSRKAQIARAVRQTTMVRLPWLAQRLHMGTPMNVSRLTRQP